MSLGVSLGKKQLWIRLRLSQTEIEFAGPDRGSSTEFATNVDRPLCWDDEKVCQIVGWFSDEVGVD